MGKAEGIAEGIEKGELKKTKKGTINLFKIVAPIDAIATAFEITETEVNEILREAGLIP